MNARLHLVLVCALQVSSCTHGVCSDVDNIRMLKITCLIVRSEGLHFIGNGQILKVVFQQSQCISKCLLRDFLRSIDSFIKDIHLSEQGESHCVCVCVSREGI
jgi:hypothetical protein